MKMGHHCGIAAKRVNFASSCPLFSTVENTTDIAGPCECSKTGCTANNGRVILAILAIAIKVQK